MNGTALRKPTARRVVGMVAGIVIIALGIALFKQSHLGNDSISALNMRLAELLDISLGTRSTGRVCSPADRGKGNRRAQCRGRRSGRAKRPAP